METTNAIRRPGISSIEKQVAEDFFDRVADEVLWAATEVYPADEWKLLSQRFISMQVRERWRAAFAAGARQSRSSRVTRAIETAWQSSMSTSSLVAS